MKMVKCGECGEKLRFYKGYRHPTMGKKHLVCSFCFDKVSDSVEKWKDFVSSNSFKYESSKSTVQFYSKNTPESFSQKHKMFDNFFTENEVKIRGLKMDNGGK